MGTWSPAAAQAAKQPPASLSQLVVTTIPSQTGSHDSITVDFAVSCKKCGHAVFMISGFPKIAPDPSPYYDVLPGQIFWRPPHSLKCVKCGSLGKAFDARKDGYDGILNGGNSYESGTDGEAFVAGNFNVTISATYNIELSELKELAAEAKVQPSDLFDWLNIHGSPIGEGKPFEIGYECA